MKNRQNIIVNPTFTGISYKKQKCNTYERTKKQPKDSSMKPFEEILKTEISKLS